MMAVVGDTIISSTIGLIFDKLASPELWKFARREKVHSELKNWESILAKLYAVLADAEEKQISNRLVKIWISELRDLAYDVEDILDEFQTEIQRQKLQQGEGSSSKVRKFFFNLRPSGVVFNFKIGSKIRNITARLEEIVKQKNELDLKEHVIEGHSRGDPSKSFKRLPSTSLVHEIDVCGRQGDKEAILKLLLSGEEACDDGFCVIPIVGMGGVGKTTLAQLVYNDARVVEAFDFKAWCCVSEDFDVIRVTQMILEGVTLDTCDANDLNLLQVRLRDRLIGKKFLIVLDDVWNENYDDWTLLRRPFLVCSPGSRIIVTTRNRGVAAIMGTVPSYLLKELPFDDCLSLFAKHALGRRNFDGHPKLKEIGEKIVKRCRGLPLAVKTLGGLLRTKLSCDEWENILNSKMWDLSEDKSGIVPALRLSYYHLPCHLKQLFAFCSIFPKDYEFRKDELVLLWMAEGFLPQPGGKKQMEHLVSCFNELLSRSFFQQSSCEALCFVMHDLINDLAQFVAGEVCFNLNDKLGKKLLPTLEKTRHMSFTRHTYDVQQRFKDFCKLKHLRTLIALPIYTSPWAAYCYLSNTVLYEVLPKLKCLTVLSLTGYCIRELPNSISGLKHLRYLNLSHTKIKCLPEAVCTLLNLQTLILYGCRDFANLPQGIGNLINLCHLDFTATKVDELPPRIGNLTCLQKLSKFIVGKDNDNGIGELKELKNLQGQLSILQLHNVTNVQHAVDANLKIKSNLVKLELEWSSNFLDFRNVECEMHVLNSLKPHTNLEELKISFFGGTRFPSWVGDHSFGDIVHLELSGCKRCTSLPSLGKLPLLRDLCVEGMDAVVNVGLEFYGESSPSVKHFSSLETLKFQNMLRWEQWSSSTGGEEGPEKSFPCLRELTLWNCPNLIGKLPSCLRSIEKLTIVKCPMLTNLPKFLPLLHELKLEESNAVAPTSIVNVVSTTTVMIRNMSSLTCLHDWFVQPQVVLKILVISNCSELKFLWQRGAGIENFYGLERIIIQNCPQFVSLTENDSGAFCGLEDLELLGLHSSMSLKDLCIESCPNLVSIPEAGLLSALKRLVLRDCQALDSLPDGMMLFSCSNNCLLEDLEIEDCPSLKCFPKGNLPTTLKGLKIRYCIKLQSLPEGMMHNDDSTNNMSHLEHLEIIGCPSLRSFPPGKLPTQLKTLKIWDCSCLVPLSEYMLRDNTSLECIDIWNSKTLTVLPECLNTLKHLTELNISNCGNLKFFPEVGLSIPNLTTLKFFDCAQLKFPPHQMQNLTCLQELTICGCPLVPFPTADLPPNLVSLEIWDCRNLDGPMSEWNLRGLTSLKDFSIVGGCFSDAVFFPDEKCLLPTTLISVYIGKLPNLESLSMWLQTLTSLEELEIVECPKLRSLPREGLPPTLGRFSIRDCPLLQQRCSKEKGVYWPMIAHVPCTETDS